MDCRHYDAFRCRSCTLLEVPRRQQLSDKETHARARVPSARWLPTFAGAEAGFRNKAKMVVGGTTDAPTLGILGPDQVGVDLRDCGLHSPTLQDTLRIAAAFITRAALTPYDVTQRIGELKHILLTESPTGEQMLRFVVRSTADEARVRKHLPWLLEQVPALRVVSLNIQPRHAAVLEGEREIVLTDFDTMTMELATVSLDLRPQSFFQTNTPVADALYAQAREWADRVAPRTIWDLYCGVGGFALALAGPGREITGIEVSAEAVASARRRAPDAVVFEAADATEWALHQPSPADLVVVNPPRRGIGPRLAGWLEESGGRHVVYSSCNADSLARDLAMMPSLRPVEARVLDMFPHTAHYEIITLLVR